MNIDHVLRAMEEAWSDQEEAFEFTGVLYDMEQVCPVHKVGQKNFSSLCYYCPVCKINLIKTLKA